MKRAIAALGAALLLAGLAGCSGNNSTSLGSSSSVRPPSFSLASSSNTLDPSSDEWQVDAGGNFNVSPIYGVFRNAETGEDEIQAVGQYNYYGELNAEELVDSLSWYTGLNFAVRITYDDLGIGVEWLPEATIFDRDTVTATFFDENGGKASYHFDDNNALRWFMLDSLAETLRICDGGLHYTMDGGKDLVLEGLTPIDTFPAAMIYEGQPG